MAKIVEATGYGGAEVLSVREIELPEPGVGQVRVTVRAAGVNPADAKAYSGQMGADPASLPMRLGFEVAGVVTAAGEDSGLAVGDEVVAFRISGGYASDVVVSATAALPKPASLGWAEAAGLLLTGATAVHTLTATAVAEGDTVLVHGGSGGVGQMAVQLAVIRGARVIATAGPRNHDLLRDLGAEPVSYGDGLLGRVRALAPDGVDAALDLVGTDEALDVSLALVADRSRIATIANFGQASQAGVKVLGGGPGADPGTELRAAARGDLLDLAGSGRLRVRVQQTFPLDRVADAHRLIGEGHTTGKLILLP